ncbi:MAG: hypothetical protein KDC92_00750 [Bacteroidetes bacterium]|nr:hypothetical protein [Bacteroidota bacterium]
MKKTLITIALLATAYLGANAQNIGFTFSRGASGVYPNHYTFSKTHSQGVSFGLTHAAPVKHGINIRTGINISALASTRSLTLRSKETVRVPDMYYYVDVPLVFEHAINLDGSFRRDESKPSVKLLGGLNAGFLWNDKKGRELTEVTERTSPVNAGCTLGAQYSIPQSDKSSFAIGPVIKFMGTGNQHSKFVGFYALQIDWKFGY